MLKVTDLHVRVDDKQILNGLNLEVKAGEVHAIMGPNGSGKSTLVQVMAGREGYEVTQGSVTYNGKDLLALPTEERAREGVFLAFQYPVEIPGVNNVYLLKAALNAVRRHRGGLDPLLDPGLDVAPRPRRQHARDDVEGQDAIDGILLAVDGEGDAEVEEFPLCIEGALTHCLQFARLQPVPERGELPARLPLSSEQLAEERAGLVTVQGRHDPRVFQRRHVRHRYQPPRTTGRLRTGVGRSARRLMGKG